MNELGSQGVALYDRNFCNTPLAHTNRLTHRAIKFSHQTMNAHGSFCTVAYLKKAHAESKLFFLIGPGPHKFCALWSWSNYFTQIRQGNRSQVTASDELAPFVPSQTGRAKGSSSDVSAVGLLMAFLRRHVSEKS